MTRKALLFGFFITIASFSAGVILINKDRIKSFKSLLGNKGTQQTPKVTSSTPSTQESQPKPPTKPLQPQFEEVKPVVPPSNAASQEFVYAAKIAIPATVHIKASREEVVSYEGRGQTPMEEFFKRFFGDEYQNHMPQQPKKRKRRSEGFGSGAIISQDGYIVTNNHVIEGADKLVVTLHNGQKYDAKFVGGDPNTDIALIKIDVKNLPFLKFGDSDALQVGEKILTSGNPFGFVSTVTAGIVSAKARNLSRLTGVKSNLQVSSYIQIDAAINQGNSGGPTINLRGEIVAINTAVYGPNGAFTGYGFCVPSSTARKVVNDLRAYGYVDRALMGILMRDVESIMKMTDEILMNAPFSKEDKENLKKAREMLKKGKVHKGVCVLGFSSKKDSPSWKAGIRMFDVIEAIDAQSAKSESELQERIVRYNPGDTIHVSILRQGKRKIIPVVLKGVNHKVKFIKDKNLVEMEGATFEEIDETTRKRYKIVGGVRVKSVGAGKWQDAGVPEGFVISSVTKKAVVDLQEFVKAIAESEGPVLIEGILPNGKENCYIYK